MTNLKKSVEQDSFLIKNSTGYYSGDQPNPTLKNFIEAHIREKPYDPINDDYNTRAFSKPIRTTKANAIYNMHTYWSKKPYTAIIEYIKHYTKPGDLVLDPMCGSGGTALAALIVDRKAIAIDLSPAATFITKNYCTPVDVRQFKTAFLNLERAIASEINWLYETQCDRCGKRAITQFVVYSQTYRCPRCLENVPLFDCVQAKIPKKTNPNETKTARVCPFCNTRGHFEEISTKTEPLGSVPVMVVYECQGHCKPKRDKRIHNDPDRVKRDYFQKYDLEKIREIELKEIPYWYPPHRMMNVESDTEPWGDEWRPGRNFRTISELYTKRNLWALAIINNYIKNNYSGSLLFSFSGILLNSSKMYRYRKNLKGGIQNGTYYLPPLSQIRNVFTSYKNKINDLSRAYSGLNINTCNINISTDDATDLTDIASNSVDYIFTDPPYAGKMQYGELNFVWEAWLDFNTNWHDNEIIINKTRGFSEAIWTKLIKQAMSEAYRVLKPGRWISLCYHDTSEGTWKLVQDIMTEVGFVPEQTDSALYIETGQKSFNQLMADKVTKRDLVINFRKPKLGEITSKVSFTGEEDSLTFNQKAITIMTDYLSTNPGATKDRVYDDLVSRMVRRGEMQPHDFDMLLNQIAEPSKAQNSTGIVERWYLKESQMDSFDQAETAREDTAAESVAKFIVTSIESNPAEEGVHYSDIFEHYIYAVQDKPRRELRDWLIDYFYVTPEGTYRPPMTDEEERLKQEGRAKGLSRRVRRFVSMVEKGVPVPEGERPDGVTLVEWILHCRRSGLFSEGRVLYERGGLSFDDLSEETQVEVEEAYYSITKQGV